MPPASIEIRPYALDDEPGVLRVWRECDLVVPQNDPVADIRRKLRKNPELFLVGVLDGGIVATCMAGYEGHRGWINYLGVRPELRRRGMARALMAEAERLLFAAGCPKINLQVRATNSAVIEFYRRLGYSVDSVTSMGKRLAEPSEDDGPPPPPREPISGERVTLVPCDASRDGEALEAVAESIPEISPWMGWCHAGYAIEEARQWMSSQPAAWANRTAFEFMVVDSHSGQFVGACGINQINAPHRLANLGYWIRTSRRGNGFAPEAARLAAGFGFRRLDLTRIEIVAAVGNLASQRAAEKAGALREGVLRHRLVVRDEVQDAVMFSFVPDLA